MSDLPISVAFLKRDKRFGPLIKKHGAPDLRRYHGRISIFEALLRSIVYQQISGKAAASIHGRVLALYPRKRPTPELVLKTDPARLRAAGLSTAKVLYVKDLAKRFLDGTVEPRKFPKMSSQEIVDHLSAIKGIGEWTAQMVLIFTLKRSDILPVGDLAIRKGFQKLYGLKEMPNKKQMEEMARPWRDHATAASWYLWRIIDEAIVDKSKRATSGTQPRRGPKGRAPALPRKPRRATASEPR